MSLLALGPTQLGHFLHEIHLPPKLRYPPINLHSSLTTLLTWLNLTESTWSKPCSQMEELYLAATNVSFHTWSVFIAAQETYGPPHPFIYWTSDKKNYNIPFSLRLNFWNITILHNAMLDSWASHNLMPKVVMERLGLEITRPYKDITILIPIELSV